MNTNLKSINLEEARNILKFAKRIYRALDGVTVEYGDSFAYYPAKLVIEIPKEISEEDEQAMLEILQYTNKEFNADFELNLRESSIHAFCHEMGHHMDFEGKIMTERIEDYVMADRYNRGLYDIYCEEFKERLNEYHEDLNEYESSDEVDEEIEFILEQKRIDLVYEDKELDYIYRQIPTEYAADEFSARFFMTYLRAYKRCNYELY
jgi:hypothetical protein